MAPARVCGTDGCPYLAVKGGRCEKHPRTPVRSPSSRATGTSKWRAIRARILERDGHVCQVRLTCHGARATEVDHVVPVSRGGGNEWSNLRASCSDCNQARNRR